MRRIAMNQALAGGAVEETDGTTTSLVGRLRLAAFLSAVRSAERCARLRTAAARDFRMFFFADSIFGTAKLSGECDGRECDFGGRNLGRAIADVKAPHGFDIISRAAYLARGFHAGTALPSTAPRLNLEQFLLALPILLFSVVAHENAHGYAALKQGDPTAHQLGRLTWNPIKHIDPFFTILLPVTDVLMVEGHDDLRRREAGARRSRAITGTSSAATSSSRSPASRRTRDRRRLRRARDRVGALGRGAPAAAAARSDTRRRCCASACRSTSC